MAREEEWGVTVEGCRVSFGDGENVLKLVVIVAQPWNILKNLVKCTI